MRPYGICLSLAGLFHLAYFPVPYMLSQKVGLHSFFLLLGIPLCKCTTFFFFLIIIVVQVQFSAFPAHPSPTPHSSLPPSHFHPRIIVHVSSIIILAKPSPLSPEILFPLPSGHCQLILNFSIFGHILLVYLFC